MNIRKNQQFDLIVIGAGPAGEKAAVKAAYFGHKVAIIEKESHLGGAGIQTGTLPSKTLKETALYYSGKYTNGLYGDHLAPELDKCVQKFMHRQKFVSKTVEDQLYENLKIHGVSLFRGKAQFISPHEIQLDDHEKHVLYGKFILVATGSYPYHPPNIPFDDHRILDSDTILRLKRLPQSLCIIGAGVIGCEYATIFAHMRLPVTLINNQKHLLPFLDKQIAQSLVQNMRKEGINILLGHDIEKVSIEGEEEDPKAIKVKLLHGEILAFDMFLFAAGRSGNTRGLHLDKAGVMLGKREQIPVNEHYQTNVPHIYAVGDVIGFPSLASTSMDQGRVAVGHMFDIKDLDSLSKVLPYGIYTIPEVSMVGLSEEQAQEKGIDYYVGVARHENLPRGKILGVHDGMMKILFDKTDHTVLGVHIVGPLACEMIHYGISLIENHRTVHQIIATVFNYPTLHDLYKYASYDALGNLRGYKVKEA
jgi:NAD(P) transhydrogenase